MATRDIRPSTAITVCDVCGRTLLRGERAEAYLHGGARRWVCELCKTRALHEGWIREGTVPEFDAAGAGSERRRSLLSRLRSRRDAPRRSPPPQPPLEPEFLPAYHEDDFDEFEPAPPPPVPAGRANEPPPPRPARRADETPRSPVAGRRRERSGEPRHVRAVPTSAEQRIVAAMDLFNASEHPRTVAGVARSLGLPSVCVLASPARQSLLTIVVAWELCWYRYEVDLSDEVPTVRPAGQGYELEELPAEERVANAVAGEAGTLDLAG